MTLEEKKQCEADYVARTTKRLLKEAEISENVDVIFRSGQWLVEQVKKHNIRNIVLMERSAILLRCGLRALLKQEEIEMYFTSVDPEDAIMKPESLESLSQKLVTHPGNILLLDEHWATGVRMTSLYWKLDTIFPERVKMAAMGKNIFGYDLIHEDFLCFDGKDTFSQLRSRVTDTILFPDAMAFPDTYLASQIYRSVITALRDCFLGRYSAEPALF